MRAGGRRMTADGGITHRLLVQLRSRRPDGGCCFSLARRSSFRRGCCRKRTVHATSARSRRGIAWNGVALLIFACAPAAIGLAAGTVYPALERPDLALPTILAAALPPSVGIIALAAVFSAEVSSADAVLFMLATSASRDLYRRFVRPAGDRGRRAARGADCGGGWRDLRRWCRDGVRLRPRRGQRVLRDPDRDAVRAGGWRTLHSRCRPARRTGLDSHRCVRCWRHPRSDRRARDTVSLSPALAGVIASAVGFRRRSIASPGSRRRSGLE